MGTQQAVRETLLEEEIIDLRKQLKTLAAERDVLAFTLDTIPEYVSYVDANLLYQVCNHKYEIETGRTCEEFVGKHVIEFIGENAFSNIQPYVERVLKGELVTYEDQIVYKHLGQQDVEVQYAPHFSKEGIVIGFSVYVNNITAQRRAEEYLRRQAQHDPLTDLPNRLLFNERLEQAVSRAKRTKKRVALLFIDLDGFKTVNDKFGHDVGDQVLLDVACCLKQNLRCNDTLARFGGDEFMLLIDDIDTLDHVKILAEKLVTSISEISTPTPDILKIGASIGIALYPDHSSDIKELFTQSDEAMYKVKNQGKCGYFIYGEGLYQPVGE